MSVWKIVLVLIVVACATRAHAQCTGEGCAPPPPSTYGAVESTEIASTELLWPAAPPSIGAIERPRLQRGHDLGLVAAGVTLMSLSLSLQLVVGALDQAARNCQDPASFRSLACDSWAFGFVPLAGGFLVGMTSVHGNRSNIVPGVFAGPLLLVPQLVGVVLLLVAVHASTEELVPGVELTPYASTTEGGLAATVTF